MEVLLGVEQLFTHSLEHKNSADETNILKEKERAWAHYHNQIFSRGNSETASKEKVSPTS